MTRLSTKQIFNRGIDQYQNLQKESADIRSRIGSGEKVQKPSDDPLAFQAAVKLKSDKTKVEQYNRNILFFRNRAAEADDALAQGSDALVRIKEDFINAGRGALDMTDREILARSLEGKLNELSSIANRSDSNGKFLFAGTKEDVQPFSSATNFVYQGTRPEQTVTGMATRSVEISANRFVDFGVTGQNIFVSVQGDPNYVDPLTGNPDPYGDEVNVFKTMQAAIDALRDPNIGFDGLTNSFKPLVEQLDDQFDRMQAARTDIGVRQNEIDTVEQVNFDTILQLETLIEQGISADLAEEISKLQLNQASTTAFETTYARISNQNLFSVLR